MTQVHEGTGEKLSRQHIGLILMLAGVVMFEGFDISATSVVLPYLSREFKIPPTAIGGALGVIALGSIAAWFLLRAADRYGRRPLLILAATGLAILTGLDKALETALVDASPAWLTALTTRF